MTKQWDILLADIEEAPIKSPQMISNVKKGR